MATFLLTRERTGPHWDPGRAMEAQTLWDEHAAFMDGLVARGVVVIGGPVGDGARVVFVCEANSSDELAAVLRADPWTNSHLVDLIEPMIVRLDGRAR